MNPTDTRDDLDFDSRESLESEMTWYIPRQARNGYSEFNGVVDHPPLGRGKAEQSRARLVRLVCDDWRATTVRVVWSGRSTQAIKKVVQPPRGRGRGRGRGRARRARGRRRQQTTFVRRFWSISLALRLRMEWAPKA